MTAYRRGPCHERHEAKHIIPISNYDWKRPPPDNPYEGFDVGYLRAAKEGAATLWLLRL